MKYSFVAEIKKHENRGIALGSKRFFKTEKGSYGYGDLFLGVKSGILRKIAKTYFNRLTFDDIKFLLVSEYHEIRLCTLMVLVLKYKKTLLSDVQNKRQIFYLYLDNADYINNWDLVDISAAHIVGDFLFNYEIECAEDILLGLANTNHLWKQRISIVSTHYFIKQKHIDLTLKLALKFLSHKHDLIHKSVGWMLREVGKIDEVSLMKFLTENAKYMPRTMLRYAIEKFDENKRKLFLAVKYQPLSL